MRNNAHLMKFLILLLCIALAVLPTVAWAQEGGEEPTEEATAEALTTTGSEEAAEDQDVAVAVNEEVEGQQGIGLLFLLLGIGSVLVVGIASIGRDKFLGIIENIEEAGSKL